MSLKYVGRYKFRASEINVKIKLYYWSRLPGLFTT